MVERRQQVAVGKADGMEKVTLRRLAMSRSRLHRISARQAVKVDLEKRTHLLNGNSKR